MIKLLKLFFFSLCFMRRPSESNIDWKLNLLHLTLTNSYWFLQTECSPIKRPLLTTSLFWFALYADVKGFWECRFIRSGQGSSCRAKRWEGGKASARRAVLVTLFDWVHQTFISFWGRKKKKRLAKLLSYQKWEDAIVCSSPDNNTAGETGLLCVVLSSSSHRETKEA